MAKPNILVLMPDQFRADTLGCAGHPTVRTPNIDRLVREGVRFPTTYTSCPICMPARSNCLSGLYCHNHGQWWNVGHMPADTPTYMSLLRDNGYRTAQIGKSHLHPHKRDLHLNEMLPFMQSLGFTDVLETTGPWATLHTDSIMTDHWQEKGILETFREDYRKRREAGGRQAFWPSPMPEGEALDDFIGRTAVEYLQAYDRDQPFCLFVGFGGPHEPWDPPQRWADAYAETDVPEPLPFTEARSDLPPPALAYEQKANGPAMTREQILAIRRLYYGKISHVDEWVGRITAVLEERGILEDTLILFWSDHGERLCDRGALHKMAFYDESARVPLILRLPGRHGAGTVVPGICTINDIFPSLLQAGGSDGPARDGTSLLPWIEQPDQDRHDAVFSEIDWHGGRTTMIRTARHKMVIDSQLNVLQLFDMTEDPAEQENLAGNPDQEQIVRTLQDRIYRWRLATDVTQG